MRLCAGRDWPFFALPRGARWASRRISRALNPAKPLDRGVDVHLAPTATQTNHTTSSRRSVSIHVETASRLVTKSSERTCGEPPDMGECRSARTSPTEGAFRADMRRTKVIVRPLELPRANRRLLPYLRPALRLPRESHRFHQSPGGGLPAALATIPPRSAEIPEATFSWTTISVTSPFGPNFRGALIPSQPRLTQGSSNRRPARRNDVGNDVVATHAQRHDADGQVNSKLKGCSAIASEMY